MLSEVHKTTTNIHNYAYKHANVWNNKNYKQAYCC